MLWDLRIGLTGWMATRAAPVAAHLAALNSGGVPISSDDQNPPADDEYYSMDVF